MYLWLLVPFYSVSLLVVVDAVVYVVGVVGPSDLYEIVMEYGRPATAVERASSIPLKAYGFVAILLVSWRAPSSASFAPCGAVLYFRLRPCDDQWKAGLGSPHVKINSLIQIGKRCARGGIRGGAEMRGTVTMQ